MTVPLSTLALRAYHATKDFLRKRQVNYRLCFGSPAGKEVLLDLAKFCRADETCLNPNPTIQAALEGRREVWLRIQHHLGLTPTQLMDIYADTRLRAAMQQENEDNG